VHRTFQGLVNNVICLEFCTSSLHKEISCATVVTITRSVAIHCEALVNTVEVYIAGTLTLTMLHACTNLGTYNSRLDEDQCNTECIDAISVYFT